MLCRLTRPLEGAGMVQRQNVEFAVEGDVMLRGWLFVPDGPGPHPAITMAHGFAGVKEHGLERFARVFADAGFRGAGARPSRLRRQRRLAALRRRPVGADRRLAPGDLLPGEPARSSTRTGSGCGAAAMPAATRSCWAPPTGGCARWSPRCPPSAAISRACDASPPDQVPALEAAFADDERRQFHGAPPATQAVVSADPSVPAAYRAPDAVAFYNQPVPEGVWENVVTLRSTRAARMYEPGTWIARVSPTPLLMVVGLHDTITVTDLALGAYEAALQPKKLVTIDGGHFDPYLTRFAEASGAAVAWFTEHLNTSENHLAQRTRKEYVMSELHYEVLVNDGVRRHREQRLPDGSPIVSSPIASTLIYGEHDAVLVDPPFTYEQVQRVGDWIERSGKHLTAVYATHGHGDHWFGTDLLLQRFPDAVAVRDRRHDRDDAPARPPTAAPSCGTSTSPA